jgi:hypothetical protein
VSVCVSVRLYVSTFLSRSSPNLEGTLYGSWHIALAIYVLCTRKSRACTCVLSFSRAERTYRIAHVREHAWLRVRLSMDGSSSNLGWTYNESHQVPWAKYFSGSRTARTRAMARVRWRVCDGACGSAFACLWTDSLQLCWEYTTNDHKLHGLHIYYVHVPRACVRALVCESARD